MLHFVKISSNYVRIWPPGTHVTLKTFLYRLEGFKIWWTTAVTSSINHNAGNKDYPHFVYLCLPVTGFLGLSILNIVEVFFLTMMFLD